MANTKHYNLPEMPVGAVAWPSLFNDVVDKLEAGRTLKVTAATTITAGKCFYINSAGKAEIASDSSAITGVWQSASTSADADGYGQVDGVMTDAGWTWTPGDILYSATNGDLTATPSTSGIIVASAISVTEVKIQPYSYPSSAITVLSKSDNYVLLASECYGTIVFATAGITITLAAVVEGMSMCVYSTGSNVIRVNPNDNDRIRLNGTELSDGVDIYSAGVAGNFIWLIGDSATGWTTFGGSGTWSQGT